MLSCYLSAPLNKWVEVWSSPPVNCTTLTGPDQKCLTSLNSVFSTKTAPTVCITLDQLLKHDWLWLWLNYYWSGQRWHEGKSYRSPDVQSQGCYYRIAFWLQGIWHKRRSWGNVSLFAWKKEVRTCWLRQSREDFRVQDRNNGLQWPALTILWRATTHFSVTRTWPQLNVEFIEYVQTFDDCCTFKLQRDWSHCLQMCNPGLCSEKASRLWVRCWTLACPKLLQEPCSAITNT